MEHVDIETGEVTEHRETALVRAQPVPLLEIAKLDRQRALAVINTRSELVETMRTRAIQLTMPEDWNLFRSDEGREIAYLQDSGCERIRPLFGIDIFDVIGPEKLEDESGPYVILYHGSGRCSFNGQSVENVEGYRSSADDFVKYKSGLDKELTVRKAARANLDGSIVRELSGLSSVPKEELDAAWEGSNKSSDRCNKAKGYGSKAERRGANPTVAPGVRASDAPLCPKCGGKTRYVRAGKKQNGEDYDAFWSCRKYPKCNGAVPFKPKEEPSSGVDEPEDPDEEPLHIESDPIPEPENKNGKTRTSQPSQVALGLNGDDIFGPRKGD